MDFSLKFLRKREEKLASSKFCPFLSTSEHNFSYVGFLQILWPDKSPRMFLQMQISVKNRSLLFSKYFILKMKTFSKLCFQFFQLNLDVSLLFLCVEVDIHEDSVVQLCPFGATRYGTVIGLGLTNQFPDRASIQLMQAVLIEDPICVENHQNGRRFDITRHLCYSFRGKAAACHGDTGGSID